MSRTLYSILSRSCKHSQSKILTFVVVLSLGFLIGCCGTIPKEAIILSESLGQDLEKIQSSYQSIIRKQYSLMKEDVERFVQEKYVPFVLKTVIEEKNVVNNIKTKAESGNYSDALNYITAFSKSANKRINKFRKELIEPLDIQEQTLLEDIDLAFNNMRMANATITAHIRSLKDIEIEQDLMLEKANLLDLKEKVINKTVNLSNRLNTFLETSSVNDNASISEFVSGLKKLMENEQTKSNKNTEEDID